MSTSPSMQNFMISGREQVGKWLSKNIDKSDTSIFGLIEGRQFMCRNAVTTVTYSIFLFMLGFYSLLLSTF
jgi:hypothetical protein